MSYTHEPWSVAEESFDNDGIHESVIRGLDGRAAIAVTLEFGANNPGMREANARRIVACVNRLAPFSTEDIENRAIDLLGGGELVSRVHVYERVIHELIVALDKIASWNEGEIGGHMDEPVSAGIARKAIAAAKGGA